MYPRCVLITKSAMLKEILGTLDAGFSYGLMKHISSSSCAALQTDLDEGLLIHVVYSYQASP